MSKIAKDSMIEIKPVEFEYITITIKGETPLLLNKMTTVS